MKDAVRIALIGAGRAGMIHARNFTSRVPNARMVAVTDVVQEAADAAAHELGGIRSSTDYHSVLEDPGVDAVVVVTPTKFHRQIVMDAAHAGKHVFCEKPMAMTAEECQDMIDATDRNGVKLQIGFMRRFDDSFRRAKEIIDSGRIGDVVSVKSLTRGPSTPHEWMYDISKSNGPLAEVNSHDIDTLRWLTGSEAASLHAMAGNFRCDEARDPYPDFYDSVLMNVRMRSGAMGNIDGAQGVQYGYDARVDVLGTHGCVQVGDLAARSTVVYTKEHGMVGDVVTSWTALFREAYVNEDISFVESIRTDGAPAVTGHDGKMAVAIVAAGNESIRTGQVVDVPS